jgi:oligoribonuclease (3'-5' exoribonuclease)
MPREDLILFLDLEATGSGDDEDIVEIGCSLLAGPDWHEVSSFTSPVAPRSEKWKHQVEVVVEMHKASGLYDVIDRDLRQRVSQLPLPDELDPMLCEWLKANSGKDRTSHIPLGGSGVEHYDRKFLKRDLPKFNKRLTYYPIDIGSTQRVFGYAGVPWAPAFEMKTHRALDDARAHAEEFRWTLDFLRRCQSGAVA